MQEQSQNQVTTDNQAFLQPSILQMRLDTEEMLSKIEEYLRGKVTTFQRNTETGKLEKVDIEMGKPKANEQGIQQILSLIRGIINPSVVQGNFKEGHYFNFLKRIRLQLAQDIMVSRTTWEITKADYVNLIDFIMATFEPFLSRLIDNKERESYAQAFRVSESNTLQQKGGLPFLK